MNKSLKLICLLISFSIILFITSRYIFIDSDSANSSLVWREIANGDFNFFKNWRPTVDNWYFNVYPVHFLLFWLFDNDGFTPVVLATSLFTFIVAVCGAKISEILFGKKEFYITLIFLTVLTSSMYRWGFVQHPFSHNSTNAFGFLSLLISILNYKKGSVTSIISVTLLSVMACISDPWYAPTFFLPIILSEMVRIIHKENNAKTALLVYTISFAIVMSHVIQRFLDIPIQHFNIVPFARLMENVVQMPLTIGRSVNFLFFDKPIAYALSFIILSASSLLVLFKMFRKSDIHIYSAALMALSILGILSSFALSNKADGYITMRFFVNVQPLFYMLTACFITSHWVSLSYASVALVMAGNIFSYVNSNPTAKDELAKHESYADFLTANGLNNGVGPYWKYSMVINWLYNTRLHITPITFNEDGSINKNIIRAQTMKSWLANDSGNGKTEINFITLKEGANKGNGECPKIKLCIDKLSTIYGKPDNMLKYEDMTIMAYDKKIKL